jgi:hypothetical protein
MAGVPVEKRHPVEDMIPATKRGKQAGRLLAAPKNGPGLVVSGATNFYLLTTDAHRI